MDRRRFTKAKETNSNKDPKANKRFMFFGGEAAQQVARDLKEAMEKEFFMKHGEGEGCAVDGVGGRF